MSDVFRAALLLSVSIVLAVVLQAALAGRFDSHAGPGDIDPGIRLHREGPMIAKETP